MIREPLLRLKSYLSGRGLGRNHADAEPPLRAELFSADQMEQHGKNLAGSHGSLPEGYSHWLVKFSASRKSITSEYGRYEGTLEHICLAMAGAAWDSRQDPFVLPPGDSRADQLNRKVLKR
jgi:hypothetical protein